MSRLSVAPRAARRRSRDVGRAGARTALGRATSCALALALGSCAEQLPGERVGTYQITMRLDETSCGPPEPLGLPSDGWRYAAELRAQAPRGYWRVPRTAPLEGRYEGGEFEFALQSVHELGSADAGTSGCRVFREELLRGTVALDDAGAPRPNERDASEEEPALAAEHQISFRPDPSGRCGAVQGPLGAFERLPCSARYRLSGSARKAF